MNLKNESELGDIYISFIYRTISFYRQHLKITCKLCTPVPLEVRFISWRTSSTNSKNQLKYESCEYLSLNSENLSFVINKYLISVIVISNLNYIFLFLKITFFKCNDLVTLFWILHSKIERSTGISTR